MIIWMLIESRRETGRVEGALVFANATKFFDNEGLVPLIHLGESNWVSWFPKDQVTTLYLCFRRLLKIQEYKYIFFKKKKRICK